MPSDPREIHDLSEEEFLAEVHSFEFWFQAIEGYLGGTTWGHRADPGTVLLADPERDRLVSVLCNYMVGELAALDGASGLVALAPSHRAKVFLATQVADEARHVEVFRHRLQELGVSDAEAEIARRASPSVQEFRRRLRGFVEAKDWPAALFAQNVVLECLEFAVFQGHAREADPVTADILRRVIKDERRHVGFGENELGRQLAADRPLRRRLARLRRELDVLVLDTLAGTARIVGLDTTGSERIGRAYVEAVERLGLLR